MIASGDLPLLASRAIRPLSSWSLPLTVAPADKLEGLRQVRVALAVALAGQFTRGAAEGLEERVVHLAVGHLCGSCAGAAPRTPWLCR